ncbi:MAG: FHA domain-containing protein [Acidimicrobiales bacterium]
MQDLEITWPEGKTRFSVADSPIHLGRSSSAAVPLTEGSVSRQHLVLVWDGASWTANDSSTHGTFDPAGVRLPSIWALSGERSVRLGGVEGVPIQIRPASSDTPRGDIPLNGAGMHDIARDVPGRSAVSNNGAQGEHAPLQDFMPPPVSTPEPLAPPSNIDVPVAAVEAPAPPASDGASSDQTVVEASPPAAPEPSFGGLFTAPPEAAQAPEPMLRFKEDSLFPGQSEQPESASQWAPDVAQDLSNGSSVQSSEIGLEAPRQVLAKSDLAPDSDLLPDSDLTALSKTDAPSAIPAVRLQQSTPALAQPDIAAPPNTPAKSELLNPGLTGGLPAIDPNSTLISDATLSVSVGGQDYSFLPGADVTIGRDPSCLIQLDERHSLVSRKHLRITFDDNSWWMEDFSSKGTFVNGKKLKKPYKAEGAFLAKLGDDDAGTPLRVITAGEHRVPRDKTTLIIAALAAAALVPLAVLALLLTRNDTTSVEPDFISAKQSTVMLFGLEGGQGSGFFVSDDLILTNQHVAVLSPQMLVGVSREADQPAEIEYATELVANHPFLDLAVLRVSNRVIETADGTEITSEPVGDIDLPAVTIGDSASVTIGDRVFNTAFPGRLSITSLDDAGALRLPSVVATSGEAGNFAFWPGCSNADSGLYIPADSPPGVACSPSGDLNRGILLSSFFSSGQGASGSAVFHENEVVAVVYAAADGEDNANLGITTAVFSDWLEEIISQNP